MCSWPCGRSNSRCGGANHSAVLTLHKAIVLTLHKCLAVELGFVDFCKVKNVDLKVSHIRSTDDAIRQFFYFFFRTHTNRTHKNK